MSDKVTKLALSSRVILLCIQFIADSLIPDHNPDVFVSPKSTNASYSIIDKTLNFCFSGLRRWDAEYFLHIAEYGYSYENSLAFYPLYPTLVGILAKSVHFITVGISLRTLTLTIGIAMNMYFFVRAANCLYELTQRIFGDLNKSWFAALLFCFNPASIFFSAPYSESLFCWLSFSLMLECVGQISVVTTSLALALSIVCRSNGLINVGFPAYFIFRKMFLKQSKWVALKLVAITFISVIPLTFFCFYAFHQFCGVIEPIDHPPEVVKYGHSRGYVLAGRRQYGESPWCEQSVPFPYFYIQSHYWDVGFLRYYNTDQVPNFILAIPVVGLMFYETYVYFRSLWIALQSSTFTQVISEWKSIPFVVHSLLLTLLSVFYAHIQITTRLLCSATPVIYWFAVKHLPKSFDRVELKSTNSIVLFWFTAYFLVGTILFSNFLPWT